MQQQQEKPQQFSPKDALTLLYVLVSSHAMAITPFLRTRHGAEAFGVPAVGAVVCIFIAMSKAPEMLYYLYAWIGIVLIRRFQSMRMRSKGVVIHSRYTGWPWLAFKLPFIKKEKTAKVLIEPMMCLLIGAAVSPLSEVLGGFLILGTFSLGLQLMVDIGIQQMKVRRMHDATIDQRQLSDMYRNGDDW